MEKLKKYWVRAMLLWESQQSDDNEAVYLASDVDLFRAITKEAIIARQQQIDRLTPRWTSTQAQAVLAVRDALVRDDYNEAYHQLVVLADTLSDDPYKHWKGLEALAGQEGRDSTTRDPASD